MQNYRIIVSYSEAKQAFVAQAPELEHCEAEAPSRAEAIAKLEEEMAAQLENIDGQGIEVPRPLEDIDFDGALSVKVSPALHRELAFMAKADGIELDSLLVELLARGVSQRWSGARGGRPREGGRPSRQQEGQGSRYHNIMENRADFIEYVRSLEQQGGGGHGGGGHAGGGRGPRRQGGRR